jgi:hypothetical protein
MDVKLSCGLLVINERGELLIGDSTGSFHWDLAKGLFDSPMAFAPYQTRHHIGLMV